MCGRIAKEIHMAVGPPLLNVLSGPADFRFDQVLQPSVTPPAVVVPSPLGPLSAFAGNFIGQGFNTIFRPESTQTPTALPVALNPSNQPFDNILELNLTQETLSFSSSLGNVPNRGLGTEADIFLNGVPYLQTINDITNGTPVGIHFEPGIWLSVPATTTPNEPVTVARLASIPHGTTIVAQGTMLAAVSGGPTIAPVDITPFVAGTNPVGSTKVTFLSQTWADNTMPRLPQNLGSTAITPAMLADPSTMLRSQIQNQVITETVVIGISTNPAAPLPGGPLSPATPLTPNFGGGPSNIAFLLGIPNPPPTGQGPNAQTFQMDAVFWIETVAYQIDVPPLPAGTPPVVLSPVQTSPAVPLQPSFVAVIPFVPNMGYAGGRVTVLTTQIQYTQKVLLNFKGLSWPHVSVASLIPADPIPIPADVLTLS
jgi:hypothetical protein